LPNTAPSCSTAAWPPSSSAAVTTCTTRSGRRGYSSRTPTRSARSTRAYFAAGADVAISASYQATFEGFAGRGIDAPKAAALMRTSVELARDAAGGDRLVAASVGPYGAMLGNGAEYTGDYDRDEDELVEFHVPRMETLAAAEPDLFAVETIPSIVEAAALVRALDKVPEVPAWVSFSCRDGNHICDGTPIDDAVRTVARRADRGRGRHQLHVAALCREPGRDRLGHDRHAVVCYPNRGSFWDPMRKAWTDPPRQDAAPPLRPLDWKQRGASLIGGCCGTTPQDIAAARRRSAERSSLPGRVRARLERRAVAGDDRSEPGQTQHARPVLVQQLGVGREGVLDRPSAVHHRWVNTTRPSSVSTTVEMSCGECPGVSSSRIEGDSSNPSASRSIHWSSRYHAQWSWTRACGNRPAFSV
jgi:homocysteine S-methyltransferase